MAEALEATASRVDDSSHNEDSTPHKCGVCDTEPAKACANCKTVFYCSEDCQKEWKEHKQLCEDYKAMWPAAATKELVTHLEGSVKRLKNEFIDEPRPGSNSEAKQATIVHLIDQASSLGDIVDNVGKLQKAAVNIMHMTSELLKEAEKTSTTEKRAIDHTVEQLYDRMSTGFHEMHAQDRTITVHKQCRLHLLSAAVVPRLRWTWPSQPAFTRTIGAWKLSTSWKKALQWRLPRPKGVRDPYI